MDNYYLITFDSTHKAMAMEKLLLKHCSVEMIPTPRELSASCGLSLKFKDVELAQVLAAIQNEDVHLDGLVLYQVERVTDGKRIKTVEWS